MMIWHGPPRHIQSAKSNPNFNPMCAYASNYILSSFQACSRCRFRNWPLRPRRVRLTAWSPMPRAEGTPLSPLICSFSMLAVQNNGIYRKYIFVEFFLCKKQTRPWGKSSTSSRLISEATWIGLPVEQEMPSNVANCEARASESFS